MFLYSPFLFIQWRKIPLCTVGELTRAASRRSLGISRGGEVVSWFNQEISSGLADIATLGALLLKSRRTQTPWTLIWCHVMFVPADFIVPSCPEFMKGNGASGSLRTACSAQTCKIKWSVEFLGENRRDESPSCLVRPVLARNSFHIVQFQRFPPSWVPSSRCACVCFADLRLWHEGWGLHLRALSTGEVLQREVRNLPPAQGLPRPLQGYGPCSRDPGERRWVRPLFTWVSVDPLGFRTTCLAFPSTVAWPLSCC